MKPFDSYPKAFKKTIRFIRQEATYDQLKLMEAMLGRIISQRKADIHDPAEQRRA